MYLRVVFRALQVVIVNDWRFVQERRANCQIHLSCGTTGFLPCSPKWNFSLGSFGRTFKP